MKQMRKKSLTFVLAFALLVGNICITPKEAKAATQSDAVAWANAQLGKGLDYDGVYGNQCVDLIKYYYAYFGVANYAMGNANAYISNSLPPGWTRVYSNYQPGDIAVWKVNHSCSTCNTGGYGHVGIITSADSTGFNAVNQNFCSKSYCTQNWFYCSALACAIRPSFTNSTNVTFSDFRQNNVWDNNAEFYVKATKSGAGNITNVGCYLYDANGSLLKSYKENCNYANYCNYTCNMVNDMGYSLSPGTTYKIVLFAIANGKEFKDSMRTFKTTGYSDTTKPVVSDVSVKDVSENGYTIRCKATDNIGVDRVQFPTWTILNGQDDIQNDWGTNILARGTAVGNNYYEYRVNVSAHNNELGAYATHIYAYDKVGNYNCVVVPTTTLTKPTPIPTPNYQEVDGNRLASMAEKEYDTYHGQSYNYQYGTSPWCCNFVSWCARQAGISTDVMKSTATVQTMYDNLINACGARVVSSPQRGDLVFYKYTDYDSQRFHHIG
ncbi:MAG: GBS Bsp-like repeat-containing protein, partial [Eubacterium sp.]|nr:GBS Bsp-like repeat-containing protein [Eubacterium sp.]